MTGENTPAPGWHPDPEGQPGQRYHDGRRWTEHFVPTPPVMPVQPAPAVAVAVANGGGPSHGLHLVLTLLTCGLWLPVWILVALFGGGGASSSVVVGPGSGVSGGSGVSAVARTSSRLPLKVVAAVIGGLFLLGLVAEHPWLLVVFAVLGGAAGFGFWLLRSAKEREEQQRREQLERDMLVHRAEREDRLYQQGDPRGVYGQYLPPETQ